MAKWLGSIPREEDNDGRGAPYGDPYDNSGQ